MPTALVALVTAAGLALIIMPGTSEARTATPPTGGPTSAQRAAIAADRAASSGLDALAKGPQESYLRRSVVGGSEGFQYVSYERTYRGLPVVGGDAVVVTDAAGNVRSTTSALRHRLALPGVTPKVAKAAAVTTARAQLARVDAAGQPTLVVLADGNAATTKLAWEVLVEGATATGPSRRHVYVDALTGKVAQSREYVREGSGNGYYNGSVTIGTSGSGSSWSMTDTTRSGIRCGGQTGTAYTGTDDAWGNGSGTNLETACVDALYAVQKEWDMLGAWLGRSGINGSGGGFPARVGLNEVNAYWNGSYTNFGHNQANTGQATPIDVVAHEFGHAIFQTTPGGAGTGNENGGLNESTGDIFGALTEAYADNPNDPADFTVGEEVNLVGSGPIRYMYNPATNGDPSCYSSAIPSTEVHAAAGPNNHWFYLTAIGSAGGGGNPSSPTCNSSTVAGIGIQKAGKIYMAALNMKTSAWRYVNVRTATLQAAVNLYGANSAECNTVKAAWNAVSVPAQAGEAQCSTAPGNDFSIAVSPVAGSVTRGSSVTTTVSTATTTGSAQTVNLSASGLPTGVTASFSPASVTSGGSSTLTLTASASAALGAKAITITGTGTSGTHTAGYTVTVNSVPTGDDFSVSLSPSSATVAPGASTSSTIATATTSGSAQTVGLSVTGSPTGVTASVSPASVTSGGSATLSIAVSATAAAGTYTLTVTGTGSATHSATFTLTVSGGGGGGCGGLPEWSATTGYAPGDQVSYSGRKWNSTWWSTGAVPGAPGSWAVWSDGGAC
ncbi:Zn-dependent metalloprotease [Allocatelliglobosispora scoriae]|uniref:Zn-dependent metalloprotease n=1 Tax=Allocatelliglobosispora scoriae TaxID=643052 RepID=A0A841C2A8_9ACTN|nr:M4 family metallopeptidase [Allocatelliglobosispora scoriae]MBB5873273.1 Zn-dependent metalloprotease [Allocatelliglobosispora scoriae]